MAFKLQGHTLPGPNQKKFEPGALKDAQPDNPDHNASTQHVANRNYVPTTGDVESGDNFSSTDKFRKTSIYDDTDLYISDDSAENANRDIVNQPVNNPDYVPIVAGDRKTTKSGKEKGYIEETTKFTRGQRFKTKHSAPKENEQTGKLEFADDSDSRGQTAGDGIANQSRVAKGGNEAGRTVAIGKRTNSRTGEVSYVRNATRINRKGKKKGDDTLFSRNKSISKKRYDRIMKRKTKKVERKTDKGKQDNAAADAASKEAKNKK